MMRTPILSRRHILAGGSAAAIAGAFSVSPGARAKTSATINQVPAFYRFRVGDISAIAISDGPLALGKPADTIKAPDGEVNKALAENFLPADAWDIAQNALAIINNGRVALFDTGMGASTVFGDRAGKLLTNLKAAGIEPGDVDDVILTHAHADHCWGLVATDRKSNFPNATIHIAQSDFDFWTDESKASINDIMKLMVNGTRAQLLPVRDRVAYIRVGQEVVPGVTAMAAPGHTVGHTVFMISSGGKALCNVADIVHHYVLSMEKPRFEFAFDTDPKQGVDTRLRLLDMLATDRIEFLAYHFPWPGIGHVAKRGDAFHYLATPMNLAQP